MPSEEENVQYLYLVLTAAGSPNIDWSAVTTDLAPLKIGAVKKRWSRLKQDMEQQKAPPGHAQQLLWLCVKHSSRDKPLDWNLIAEKCNTTPGAAAKRYSRMKQAFENGTAVAPGAGSAKSAATDGKATTTAAGSKRKRATGNSKETQLGKNAPVTDDEDNDEEANDEVKEEEDKPKPKRKRARTTKKAATAADDEAGDEEVEKEDKPKPKPKRARTTKKAAVVKEENPTKSKQSDGDKDVKDDNEHALPSEQLIGELEAAVRDAQAKYHGGDGEAAEGEEVLDEAEKKEIEAEKAESCFKVEVWLKSLEGLSVAVY